LKVKEYIKLKITWILSGWETRLLEFGGKQTRFAGKNFISFQYLFIKNKILLMFDEV